MANYLTTDTDLTSVANAIRTKGGTAAQLSFPSGFVSAIQAIPTGGGGGSITQDQDGYLVLSPDGGGGGGGGLEYEEGTFTPESDTAIATISFSNSHTSPPMMAYMFDSAPDTMGSASDTYFGCCTAFIGGLVDNIQDASFPFYGVHRRRYAVGSESRASFNSLTTVSNYITNTQFMPQGNNTGAYWRAGRTYKWIAVWPPAT